MALDLNQLTEQLKDQLADLSQQRAEIQKELEAVKLIRRASLRTDSLPLKQAQEAPSSELEPTPVIPATAQPQETTLQEDAPAIIEESTAAGEIGRPATVVVEKEETGALEATLQEVVEPVEAVEEEEVAELVERAAEEEVPVAEELAQPEATSLESTTQVEVRRTQLEETVMGLELNDEVAILELLKMFQKPLSPGKIAEELVAVHWNFQGQHPRAAVNAALQKMVDQGRVQQVNGGDYGLSI